MAKKDSFWNYRIIAKKSVGPTGRKYIEYGITEVYYKDDKIIAYCPEYLPAWGETVDDLKFDFKLMKKAFKYPVLTDKDLPKEKKKKAEKKNEKSKS